MIVGSSFARATTGGSAQSAEGSNHSAPLGPGASQVTHHRVRWGVEPGSAPRGRRRCRGRHGLILCGGRLCGRIMRRSLVGGPSPPGLLPAAISKTRV